MGIRIRKTSSYLPKRIVDNFYFEKILDTSDSWISSRTGIKTRHFVEGEDKAALIQKAIARLELSQEEINRIKLVIVATSTSSYAIPNLASHIQARFGLREDIYSLDINMGCSGFVAGLQLIEGILEEGEYGLLVGAEVFSDILDFKDRNTAILFGDGAGAVLVEGSKSKNFFKSGTRTNLDVLNYGYKSSGLYMEGREVYKFVVSTMKESILDFLKEINIKKEDIDYFISHQANIRMLESIASSLDLSMDKFPSNIDRVGNTSCASIPLLLDDLNKKGRLKVGDKIVILGFGAGLTWVLAYTEW